jgi:hypothetical protein
MAWPKGKPRDDLTGQKYGRLTVTKQTDARIERSIAWDCLCECGNRRLVRGSALKSGNTTSCGCYQKERQRSAVTLPEGEAAFRRVYRGYRRRAKQKEWAFSLALDDFRELTKKNCHYCNSGPTNLLTESPFNGVYPYNGLDRVDTTLGYEPHNVVPCCKHCNVAKRAMTQDEFASWVDRIYTHWARKYWDS